jgi:hypothetical protein
MNAITEEKLNTVFPSLLNVICRAVGSESESESEGILGGVGVGRNF